MAVRKYSLARGGGSDILREFPPDIAEHLEAAGGYTLVTAYDARDVESLVEAVRETLCDDTACARCDSLRALLAPFDREGGEQGG